MPDRDDAARMMRLSMYTHAPGLIGLTACGTDQQWQLRSQDPERVDCPECLAVHAVEDTMAGRPALTTVHYTPGEAGGDAVCGALWAEGVGIMTSNNPDMVTCADCRHRHGAIAEETAGQPAESGTGMDITEREQLRRKWTVAAVGGDTELGFEDWLHERRLRTVPYPEYRRPEMGGPDGHVFTFYDAHPEDRLEEHSLEVVPQTPSGNVEIVTGDTLFTLSHADRMDLVRALLHDFHYSPETGAPADD